MGASHWSCFTAYQPTPEEAFEHARRDVFARREFYASPGSEVSSIDELLELQAEDGTHSILDMCRVRDEAGPGRPTPEQAAEELLAAIMGAPTATGTIYRMSDDELQKCFGTLRPTRAVVESSGSAVHRLCRRGTGRFTVVFDDVGASPIWVYFAGVSGD